MAASRNPLAQARAAVDLNQRLLVTITSVLQAILVTLVKNMADGGQSFTPPLSGVTSEEIAQTVAAMNCFSAKSFPDQLQTAWKSASARMSQIIMKIYALNPWTSTFAKRLHRHNELLSRSVVCYV